MQGLQRRTLHRCVTSLWGPITCLPCCTSLLYTHTTPVFTPHTPGLPTCVVYGALPAETRRAQARQFNDPSSPAKVLVASDAIGMGLNFNIRRVIFTTLSKRSATSMVPVPPALVKQIAGRAGRRNRWGKGVGLCSCV